MNIKSSYIPFDYIQIQLLIKFCKLHIKEMERVLQSNLIEDSIVRHSVLRDKDDFEKILENLEEFH